MKRLASIFILLCCVLGLTSSLKPSDAWTHSTWGAGLAHAVQGSAAVSFLIGVASHIPLDMIPHYEFQGTWPAVINGLLTVGSVYLLYEKYDDPRILWGALGALIVDLEHVLAALKIIDESQKIFPTHNGLIKHGDSLPLWPGIGLTIGLNAISLTVFF